MESFAENHKGGKEFAIIDVETTGGGSAGNRMTEIAIFTHDGKKISGKFQTLINPGCPIPPSISFLTGITNEMVRKAPRFEEVARTVFEMTDGKVFVAHSVAFDYGVVRNEFARLGGQYQREKLCTVRMSRAVFPGLKSYSLGRLCESLGIEIQNRHRAEGDARATVRLFEMLIENDRENHLGFALKHRSREQNFPPNLGRDSFEKLPSQAGVYYFHDPEGKVIYVGKSINIRDRVSGHFSDKSFEKLGMRKQITDISFELTGSELVALLHESEEIRRLWPLFNHAQKYRGDTRVIISYVGNDGILRLDITRSKISSFPLASFPGSITARNFLSEIINKYELCPKYCGLEKLDGPCFFHKIKKCRGVCAGAEEIESYNLRVREAIQNFSLEKKSFIVVERGRDPEEKAIVLVEKGMYRGFGFIPAGEAFCSWEELRERVVPRSDNPDIQRILARYLRSGGGGEIIHFAQ